MLLKLITKNTCWHIIHSLLDCELGPQTSCCIVKICPRQNHCYCFCWTQQYFVFSVWLMAAVNSSPVKRDIWEWSINWVTHLAVANAIIKVSVMATWESTNGNMISQQRWQLVQYATTMRKKTTYLTTWERFTKFLRWSAKFQFR